MYVIFFGDKYAHLQERLKKIFFNKKEIKNNFKDKITALNNYF